MTTALAFDLFLDEYDVLEDGKLFTHIKNELKSKGKTTSGLTVVKNDTHKFKNPKNEINKIKSLFKKEATEIEILKNEMSFFEYGFKKENDISEIEVLDSEKIRKDMMKGYMELLSN